MPERSAAESGLTSTTTRGRGGSTARSAGRGQAASTRKVGTRTRRAAVGI